MTNGEVMSYLLENTFGIELSIYGDSVPKRCKFIKCPQTSYSEQCSTCKYQDFWEQDYDEKDDIQLITELELIKVIIGLSRTEREVIEKAIEKIKKGKSKNDSERVICKQKDSQ